MSPNPARPTMYYFGPWDSPGHYFFDEQGRHIRAFNESFPWHWSGHEIDGKMQPGAGVRLARGERLPEVEGEALLHHKDGWTALCMWDRSVDARGACNSNYLAEGIFSFDEMVAMASQRFVKRWNKMKFAVKVAETPVSA